MGESLAIHVQEPMGPIIVSAPKTRKHDLTGRAIGRRTAGVGEMIAYDGVDILKFFPLDRSQTVDRENDGA